MVSFCAYLILIYLVNLEKKKNHTTMFLLCIKDT